MGMHMRRKDVNRACVYLQTQTVIVQNHLTTQQLSFLSHSWDLFCLEDKVAVNFLYSLFILSLMIFPSLSFRNLINALILHLLLDPSCHHHHPPRPIRSQVNSPISVDMNTRMFSSPSEPYSQVFGRIVRCDVPPYATSSTRRGRGA